VHLFPNTKKNRKAFKIKLSGAPAKESMRQDLNLRPLRPEKKSQLFRNKYIFMKNAKKSFIFKVFSDPQELRPCASNIYF
jgi:hypothetical protein